MEKMRAVVLTAFGGYEKVKVQEVPKPTIEADHVIVEVKASGMNFSDLYTRQGIYTFHEMKPPFIMGMEAAGVISETSPNSTEFKIGDRVLCWGFRYGMWAEFVKVHKSQCHLIPESMTFIEANSIVSNYLTAYFAVLDFGHLRPNQSILIQAAAGGVGWAATQLAKTVENVTVFGTASASKHELIVENGVTHPIDYRKDDFVEEVLKASPLGVNVVVDCLSGLDFLRAQNCLKHMGRIIHIGISNMVSGEKRDFLRNLKVWWQAKNIQIANITNRNHAICGLNIIAIFENDPDAFKYALEKVMELYTQGKIKPRIDSIWSFDEVIEATKCIVERKNVGKVVLVPKKEDSADKVESYQN